MSARIASLAALILVAWCACASADSDAAETDSPAPPFIITFWCGPPLHLFDDARARQIADAGFDVVGPPCEGGFGHGATRSALDIAARHGLRMWINDPRLRNALEQPEPDQAVRKVVDDYRNHPALDGYLIIDEPTTTHFRALGAVMDEVHEQDPGRLAYVNLLPDYVGAHNLGAPTYDAYLEQFIAATQPRLLSYDYYPFRKGEDRPSFFANLASVRAAAARHRLPFMLIVLAMPHSDYRDPTEAELAWQIFHALAFGARGISYFAYWTPVRVPHANLQRFRTGLIEKGEPTRHYFEAQRLNRTVRAFAEQLADFRSLAITDSAGQIGDRFPFGPIEAIDGGAVTAGWFTDEDGRLAVMLVNRDYRRPASVTVRLRPGTPVPEQFEPEQRAWRLGLPAPLRIEPGRAALLRWSPPSPSDPKPLLSRAFLIEKRPGESDRLGNHG